MSRFFIIAVAAALLLSGAGARQAAAQDPSLAEDDLGYFQKQFADGHLIAQAQLQTGPNSLTRYRYDRFPGVQRLVLDDGSVYMNRGDSWVQSGDWSAGGGPQPDTKNGNKLDEYAAIVMLPFQEPIHNDPKQGKTVWKLADHQEKDGYETFTYEETREHPHKGGVYPQFTFVKRTGDQDGYLALQWFTGQIRSGDQLVPVRVRYDLKKEKTPGAQPEELVFLAKQMLNGKPLKVDADAGGAANCRIAGILSGRNFDLTVMTPERTFRQIEVGANCWLSADGGKTWKKQAPAVFDKRYYLLVYTPLHYDPHEMIPPFETVNEFPQDGASVRWVRLLAPETVHYDGDRSAYWLTMKDNSVTGIRHFDGPMLFDTDYVILHADYSAPGGNSAVLPPPGNPAAVPQTGPEMLLMAALGKMADGSVWKVDAEADAGKKARITGLISGQDFDLTETPLEGGTAIREIAIKRKAWGSFDGGATWRKEKPDDRLPFNIVNAAMVPGRMEVGFETLDKEEQEGGALVHIRVKDTSIVSAKPPAENVTPGSAAATPATDSDTDRMNYWLLLDKAGNAVSVRRYSGPIYMGGDIVHCDESFTKADGEKIMPPKGK